MSRNGSDDMKKPIAVLFAFLLLLLSSCTSLPEPDAHELADRIISEQTAREFDEADSDMISILFGLDVNDFSDYAVYYSKEPANADIVVIFKSDKKKTLDSAKDILEEFRKSRIEDFKGYAPEEAAKLEEAKVISKGKYDIFVVMPDNEAVQKAINTEFEG